MTSRTSSRPLSKPNMSITLGFATPVAISCSSSCSCSQLQLMRHYLPLQMKTLQHLGWLGAFFVTRSVFAQFTPALIQNDSYWGDGKAEYSIYGAELVREGAPRQCEVVHILLREAFDSKQLVKTDDAKRDGAFAVLKLNQIMTVQVGLLTYQQMHSSFWRTDNAKLVKFSLTSSDSYGNAYKEALRNGEQFAYEYRIYSDGAANGQENFAVPPNG